MSAKTPMNQPTRGEKSYGFGWARVQLPGTMGDIGCNPPLMPHGMPVVGKGAPSQLVIYHQGSLPGALAAVILIPDTKSAIVILTNSLSLNDTPDWVGQLILEELLNVPERND
jgi:Beta-lactamase